MLKLPNAALRLQSSVTDWKTAEFYSAEQVREIVRAEILALDTKEGRNASLEDRIKDAMFRSGLISIHRDLNRVRAIDDHRGNLQAFVRCLLNEPLEGV